MLEVERLRDNKTGQSGTATARAVQHRQPPVESSSISPETKVTAQPSPVPKKGSVPVLAPQVQTRSYQTGIPVITGEANYSGMLRVEGVVTGQLGGGGGSLAVRQKSGTIFSRGPELSGKISFLDLVRVNGYIAGTVYSERGTLVFGDYNLIAELDT